MTNDYDVTRVRLETRPSTFTIFEIFQNHDGHWCARSADGMVFGEFFKCNDAVRFARHEGNSATPLVLFIRGEDEAAPHRKKAA
ncbi:MAG TPA: hypothetical protein VEJ16_16160 [Alphaproteobacteria bacterium]|nr:hypothetical protein [Alphaproteobacteria bacterium]